MFAAQVQQRGAIASQQQAPSKVAIFGTRRTACLRGRSCRAVAASGPDGQNQSGQEQYTANESSFQMGTEGSEQQAYPGAPPPYQQYYQGYPNYPPYPYPQQQKSSGGGLPFYVWIGVGALVMWGYSKISGLVRGGPQAAQAKMMSWAMEQAMNQGKGGAPGGMPPGFPNFGAGGPGAGGFSMPPNFGGPAAQSSPVDTTARTVDQQAKASPAAEAPPAASTSDQQQRGARFEELKAQASGTGRAPRADKPKRASFRDVDDEASTSSQNGAAAGSSTAQDFRQPEVMGDGSEANGEGNKFTADLMDQFFRDPNMQQLLYKYLPEPMRNPQTFEWMLSNPEYRKQLEGMMEQQGMNLDPSMMNMMKDLDGAEMNKQLETLGLSPSEVINKIMAEPELAAAFQKPKVMQAIMESQNNPLAIMNYQDDPDVMLVFEKMAKLFPQAAMPNGGPPPQ
ncbi:g7398 [Coccomyxa viridis]|uniref:G7398 protein n=1 Tax=Coccomyxa viridis TaxID=1274662 RepID=A0ABP1FXQ9_9CHLO